MPSHYSLKPDATVGLPASTIDCFERRQFGDSYVWVRQMTAAHLVTAAVRRLAVGSVLMGLRARGCGATSSVSSLSA